MRLALLTGVAVVAACSNGSDAPKERAQRARAEQAKKAAEAPPIKVVGTSPVDFACDTAAAFADVEAAIGVPLEQITSAFQPPAGVAKPCHYSSLVPDQPGEWSFDIDCRDRALDDGVKLMAQYAATPGSRTVMIGRSGLDHHGAQLIFIDDDAPCYVRVHGAGERERLALAQLVLTGLTRQNAPGHVSFVEVTTGEMQMDTAAPAPEPAPEPAPAPAPAPAPVSPPDAPPP